MVSAVGKRNAAVQRQRCPVLHTQSLIGLIQDNEYRTVAEVGVYKCLNAARVLRECKVDVYHLVDPWQPYGVEGGEGEKDAGCPLGVGWEELYQRALWLKTQYPVQVWRLPSVEASWLFQRELLDLVFIDGDHSYQAVRDDIEAWLPIVRTGGILAGHDYYQRWPGVVRAVDELLDLEALQFLPDTIWYVVK